MAMEFARINVEGMSCNHCVNAVKTAVEAIDGVSSVEVSLENNTASVEFDPAKTNVDEIKFAIGEEGYGVD